MKKNIFKQVKNTLPLCAMVATVGFTACTSDFESINTDPNGIPAEEVALEARFSQPITSVYLNFQNRNYEYQLQLECGSLFRLYGESNPFRRQ